MATGFKVGGGADLDTIFAARVGAAGALTGLIASSGQDLANVFEQRGGFPVGPATGFRVSGVDINNRFKTAGSVTIVNVSTTLVTGGCGRSTPGSCSAAASPSVTASVSGGVGPFSYLWEYVSGTAASVAGGSTATASFNRSGTCSPETNTLSGVYRCKVTDSGAGGAITYSPGVTVATNHTLTV